MSKILDLQGNEVQTDETWDCEHGTEMLGQLVGCTITKDDCVHTLKLNFGPTTAYTTRIPNHEYNPQSRDQVWKDMLTNAFSAHEIGKSNRGMLVNLQQGIKSPEPQ